MSKSKQQQGLANRSTGFTLIEVMITVAIIGILAAVALPSYKDYVRRGQLPEAFATLADYRIKLEQYYQDNRAYGSGTCANATAAAWKSFAPTGAKYFSYGCALSNSGQGYTLTATGTSTTQANGHVYTLDQDNVKKTTTFKGASSSKTCWLTKGDEC